MMWVGEAVFTRPMKNWRSKAEAGFSEPKQNVWLNYLHLKCYNFLYMKPGNVEGV